MVSTHSSLLLRLRSPHDSEAWSRLVHLYAPLIRRWVARLSLEANQTEDLVQDILLLLVEKVSEFIRQRPGSFRAWLRTIATNKALDYLRRQKKLELTSKLEALESTLENPAQWISEQEYRTILAQNALRLMSNSFSEVTCRAVWEHVAQGRSAAEVAAELGITENAVYLARGRVLKRLRQELDGLWE
jgi:RNA polymerase sigma-70 factor, ECF subfamily